MNIKTTTRTSYNLFDSTGTLVEKGLKKAYADKRAEQIGGFVVAYTTTLTAGQRSHMKYVLGR